MCSCIAVYGVSASTPRESHCACFYDEERQTFLAGEFTARWLFHCDTVGSLFLFLTPVKLESVKQPIRKGLFSEV